MAMNKKEQAAHEEALRNLRIATALRFTSDVERDVPAPNKFMDGDSRGWDFNAYDGGSRNWVSEWWSSSVTHGQFYQGKKSSASQRSVSLYSSKLLALKACRRALEQKYAKTLAELDELIEQESEAK